VIIYRLKSFQRDNGTQRSEKSKAKEIAKEH